MRRRKLLTATAGYATFAGVASARHDSPSSRATQETDTDTSDGQGTTSDASSQSEFGPLGWTSVDRIKEVVVGPDDEIAYAAVTDGFATIDISDPANPSVLAERRDLLPEHPEGPMEQIYDVKRDGDRLAVVGPANPRRNTVNAALFYDVSDPAEPEQLAVHETGYPIHNCFFQDGIAYLTANNFSGNGLVMVELDDGETEEVGRWSIADADFRWEEVFQGLWTLHDLSVQGDYAYLAHWDAGTWIVDVSDPGDVAAVARVRGRAVEDLAELSDTRAQMDSFGRPGNDHYVTVDEDASLLVVGVEAWDSGAGGLGPGGITLYDISTPSEPEELSTIEAPPTPDPTFRGTWTTSHNFDLVDDHLYTSWYQGGVRVFDIGDPADPVELAAYRNDEETSFWTAQHAGDCFVASSGEKIGDNLPKRLYTFPDPSGDGPTGGSSSMPGAATETATETATATSVTNTTTNTAADTTTGSGPGFGVLGALAGLGLGAWRLGDDGED